MKQPGRRIIGKGHGRNFPPPVGATMTSRTDVTRKPCPIESRSTQQSQHFVGAVHGEAGLLPKLPIIEKNMRAKPTRAGSRKPLRHANFS